VFQEIDEYVGRRLLRRQRWRRRGCVWLGLHDVPKRLRIGHGGRGKVRVFVREVDGLAMGGDGANGVGDGAYGRGALFSDDGGLGFDLVSISLCARVVGLGFFEDELDGVPYGTSHQRSESRRGVRGPAALDVGVDGWGRNGTRGRDDAEPTLGARGALDRVLGVGAPDGLGLGLGEPELYSDVFEDRGFVDRATRHRGDVGLF
jgi:hypothetical protein